jgi:uncharacterized protein (DUF305 family)
VLGIFFLHINYKLLSIIKNQPYVACSNKNYNYEKDNDKSEIMNTQFKFLITLLCGKYFFSGCNNGSNSAIGKDTDLTKMKNRKYDTIQNKLNTGKMKTHDGIETAINNMTNKIKSIKLNGNVDIDFANIIIECHRGAVDMSLQEIKSGTDAGMKALAKEIIRNQMDEQSKFRNIANSIKPIKTYLEKNDKLSEEIAEMKSNLNTIKMTQDLDKDYVNLMIKHHESEIEMAKYEVSNGMNTQLKQMAQKIISDQTKGNSLFKKWLSVSK